jgi:hypothetical protein
MLSVFGRSVIYECSTSSPTKTVVVGMRGYSEAAGHLGAVKNKLNVVGGP